MTIKSSDSISLQSDSTGTSFQSCQTNYLSVISSGSDINIFSKTSPKHTPTPGGHVTVNTNQNSRESAAGSMPRSVSGTTLQKLGGASDNRESSFRKNRSAQDLKKLSNYGSGLPQRLQSVESDIVILDRRESTTSGYTTGSDISVLTGSDITVCTNPSARNSTTDSDILIIQNPSRQNSVFEENPSPSSNDITILPTPTNQSRKTPSSSENSSMMGTPINTIEAVQLMREGVANVNLGLKLQLDNSAAGDPERELSPTGSISTRTVSSLVSSVYENTLSDTDQMDNEPSIYGSAVDERFVPSSKPEADSSSFQSLSSGSGDINLNQSAKTSATANVVESDRSVEPNLSSVSTVSGNSAGLSSGTTNNSGIRFSYEDYKQVDHRLKLYIDMNLFTGETEEFSLVLKVS